MAETQNRRWKQLLKQSQQPVDNIFQEMGESKAIQIVGTRLHQHKTASILLVQQSKFSPIKSY